MWTDVYEQSLKDNKFKQTSLSSAPVELIVKPPVNKSMWSELREAAVILTVIGITKIQDRFK